MLSRGRDGGWGRGEADGGGNGDPPSLPTSLVLPRPAEAEAAAAPTAAVALSSRRGKSPLMSVTEKKGEKGRRRKEPDSVLIAVGTAEVSPPFLKIFPLANAPLSLPVTLSFLFFFFYFFSLTQSHTVRPAPSWPGIPSALGI